MSESWNYNSAMLGSLRFPFKGANLIEKNYSQSFQDIFVLSILNGQRNGIYLEVGAHKPDENNNTFLLDNWFGWKGVSLELDPSHLNDWRGKRPNSQIIITDALAVDYRELLRSMVMTYSRKPFLRSFCNGLFNFSQNQDNRIDYLQLDIDPSINTLAVLKLLPLDEFRFSVITFETDVYTRDFRAQAESRSILLSHGYQLVAPDVMVQYDPISNDPIPFEDWWVDPAVINRKILEELMTGPWSLTNPKKLLFKNQ